MESREIWRAARDAAAAYGRWWTGETGERLTPDSEVDAHLQTLVRSIDYRYKSLEFHVGLLELTTIGAHDQIEPGGRTRPGFLRSVANQHQYAFDDLIFNLMSLFDYIGCLVGLVVEEPSARFITWSKARGKVKHLAAGSRVQPAMDDMHRSLVKRLKRYRSQLIHHSRDEGDGWIVHDYMDGSTELTITVPEVFVSEVRLPGVGKDTSISEAGQRIVDLAGGLAHRVLVTLEGDIRNRRWSNGPRNPVAMEARWRHAGYWRLLAGDDELQRAGVEGCGAIVTAQSLVLVLRLSGGRSLETAPIDLLSFFDSGVFDGWEVKAALRAAARAALESDHAGPHGS